MKTIGLFCLKRTFAEMNKKPENHFMATYKGNITTDYKK